MLICTHGGRMSRGGKARLSQYLKDFGLPMPLRLRCTTFHVPGGTAIKRLWSDHFNARAELKIAELLKGADGGNYEITALRSLSGFDCKLEHTGPEPDPSKVWHFRLADQLSA